MIGVSDIITGLGLAMPFLPGLRYVEPAPPGALTSVSFVTSGTSTAANVTGPAGIQAGDILVLYDAAGNTSGTPSTVIPSGFTELAGASAGTRNRRVSYKLATGAEASASITGMNGTSANHKAILVFRGDATATSVSPGGVVQPAITDGNPADETITAGGGAAPLIVVGAYGSTGAVSPIIFTPTEDGTVSVTTAILIRYKIYNASPADVTIGMNDEGNGNGLLGGYLAVG